MSVGHRIRMARLLKGWTQARLAAAAHMHTTNVAHFEGDGREPTIQSLTRIAQALGVTTDFLLGLEDTRTLPEDPPVLALCEVYGFGAVMHSAAKQWAKRDPVGALTVGDTRAAIASATTGEPEQ